MFDINPRAKPFTPPPDGDLSLFVSQNYNAWKAGLGFDAPLPLAKNLPAIIAVGGGKGGVGKSIVSANMAATLSQFGYRVLVVDLDLGCSNLHTHFGVSMPKRSLSDFLVHQTASFRDIILPSPVQGVAFIAGGREEVWADYLDKPSDYLNPLWQGLIASRQQFKVDVVLIDLGAGTHRHTMDFFSSAHLGVVTVLPEPSSIENAYAFFKMTLWKLCDNLGQRLGQIELAQEIKQNLASMAGTTLTHGYASCLRDLATQYPAFVQELMKAMQGRTLGIVINQSRDQSDIDLGSSMEHICQKYFGLPTKYLGYLNYDESVLKSLKNRRLLVSDFPHSMISKRIAAVTAQSLKILGMQRRTG